ncbi:hypothetical protein [Sandaracinobacteroides hominis]|uniref:hypothetical protein n=1 Tax=Sandaracinobacteroides hominis TaxID=2780086 RepID=UPI0018F31326|nr:hypothetical protein [Sandaracinobacteroides hominis]
MSFARSAHHASPQRIALRPLAAGVWMLAIIAFLLLNGHPWAVAQGPLLKASPIIV